MYINLVGGLDHVLFSHVLGIVLPTGSYLFKGKGKPPTRNYQWISMDIEFIPSGNQPHGWLENPRTGWRFLARKITNKRPIFHCRV